MSDCMRKKGIGARIACSLIIICMVLGIGNSVKAEEELLPYAENNINRYLIQYSSLAVTDTGYVRMFNTDEGIYVEEYDDSFEITGRRSIETELSYFGGFFSGSDGYYFVFGQDNKEEDNDTEVVRVVKYSKTWERVGAASLKGDSAFGHEIRFPFYSGNCNMAEYDGTLYIVTAHQGYVDAQYGMGHVGFLMFAVDEETMTGKIMDADLWHSFSQHIAIKDSENIYVLEESEGSRYTKVTRMKEGSSGGTEVPVFEYGGSRTSAWAIATYATADAIALSDKNVLAVGTSIDQSRYDDETYEKSYNIYLTVTPMDEFTQEATTVKWLTDDNLVGGYRDVKLTKLSDDRFLLCWEKKSEDSIAADEDYESMSSHVLHYVFLDGDGEKISQEYTVAASLSECEPILKDGKVVFYACDGGNIAFYTIDAEDGTFEKKLYMLAGEHAAWSFSGDTLTISGSGETYSDMGSTSFGAIVDKATKLVISDGITKLGDNAFSGMSSLTDLTFGKDVTEIGSSAFSRCTSLKSVRLPKGITTVGSQAFYGIRNFESIYIPATVTSIGEKAFQTGYYWVGSGSPVVAVTIYCEKDSAAYNYAVNEGISYVTCEVKLADKQADYTGSAIEIDAAVVQGTSGALTYTYYTDEACTKATTSENGAASEGAAPVNSGNYYVKAAAAADDVFSEIVSNVAKLEIKAKEEEQVDQKDDSQGDNGNNDDQKGNDGDANGNNDNKKDNGKDANGKNENKKDNTTEGDDRKYVDKDTVTETQLEKGLTFSDDATDGDYRVMDVTEVNGVIVGGTVAYTGPSSMAVKKAVIPKTIQAAGKTFQVTDIAKNAFKGCKKLKTVTIGSSVESIGDSAFEGCKALTKLTIPAKAKKIGKNAFKGCKSLKSVTIKSTKFVKTGFGRNAFKNINAKAVVKVPKKQYKNYKKWLKRTGLPGTAKVRKQG